jgi:hypothetical protein
MTETVMNTKSLHEILLKMITTEKVHIKQVDGEIHIIPINESVDYIEELYGSLADYPEMSADKFLERKHADKELEL